MRKKSAVLNSKRNTGLINLLSPLVDQDLAVVFYDMTTILAEGLSQQNDDAHRFGMSKEGGIARQFMLGVVQTAEGLPLYHEVFDGNTAEVTTLKPSIEKIVRRLPSSASLRSPTAVCYRPATSRSCRRFACPAAVHSSSSWPFPAGITLTSSNCGAVSCAAVRQRQAGSAGGDQVGRTATDHCT